jgi:transcriptional regulator with XRE-family HTH domain
MQCQAQPSGGWNGLGDFLRARRARLSPEKVGLVPEPTTRRVPGLRREEVARLAGVSVDYYIRLERGRKVNASESVLDAVARALRLTEVERGHLFTLARPAPRRPRPLPPQRVRPGVHRLLETMTEVPALVLGRGTDILASNRLARALYTDFDALPPSRRNMARFVFLDEAARRLHEDWEWVARAMVANLRLHTGRYPGDPRLAELVGELAARDADFRTWWAEHDLSRRTHGTKRFNHPLVGELTLQYEALAVTGDPDQILGVHTAAPGSPSERALRLLAEVAAAPQGRGRARDHLPYQRLA